MSTRNPLNERNTMEGKKAGVTRKSAASAKPVTKAAASVRTVSKKPQKKGLFGGSSSSSSSSSKAKDTSTKATKAEVRAVKHEQTTDKATAKRDRKAERARKRAVQSFVPDTEEFKRLNRKRMIYSAIGLVGMIAAIMISLFVPNQMVLSIGIMIVAWVFFFLGVRIDSQDLRPLRERGYAEYERKMMRKARKDKK